MVNSVGFENAVTAESLMLLLHSRNESWSGGKPPCLLVIGGERRDNAFRSWAVDSVIALWQGANWHRRTPVQVDYSMISLSG